MPTKRVPLHRDSRRVITAEAVRLFSEMRVLGCACGERDWSRYWEFRECTACKKWWELHSQLHDQLHSRPWEWPCISAPDEPNPYPPGCYAAQRWARERVEKLEVVQAIELWKELEGLAQAAAKPKKRRQ
jgi:hypothetical protein